MKAFKLPDHFLLGSATAATQIEGGDKNNSWYNWCEKGHIKDRSTCLRANDHWNRYKEDIALMEKLNHKVYRMGLEWSRIEPQEGRFDDEAIAHYRDEITLLLEKGIKPLVTLHHFTNPLWLERMGGFEDKSVVWYFERYVKYVVERLGDLVSEYITINEPNVYATLGYYFGVWPPGVKSIKRLLKVYRNMALCHITAYKLIHKIRKDNDFPGKTMVGVANHVRIFDPYNKYNPLDILAAKIMDYLFQGSLTKSMSTGFLRPPVGLGAPKGGGRYFDFIGINYYTRDAIRFKGFRNEVMPGTPRNDLNWEIYPRGLYRICKKYYRLFTAPIWITENGTCDGEDRFRSRFIYDHLYEISKLCKEGIPVERYYHWTLMDNFEWVEGESARFGLYHVDYDTQVRTLRKSGRFYGEICKRLEVTDDMIDKYLKD